MILRILFTHIFTVTSLMVSFPQQQQRESPTPRLFNKFGDTNCEMIDLYLDEYIYALWKEPTTQAYIICYSRPTDSPGKILRYMNYIQGYLYDRLEKDSRSVSVVKGGYRSDFSIELWIVPDGAPAPTPTGSTTEIKTERRSSYKFDEAEAIVMEYNKSSYLAFGLLCTLTNPDWREFFRILRDEPGLRGHIIIYVGHDDSPKYANRIETFLRNDLKEYDSEKFKQLTMAYGGKREWSQIEIWVVPKDRPNPKPTPKAKTARNH